MSLYRPDCQNEASWKWRADTEEAADTDEGAADQGEGVWDKQQKGLYLYLLKRHFIYICKWHQVIKYISITRYSTC